MPSVASIPDPPLDDEFKFKKGANWQPDNVKTLMQWIHISAIYIDILGESTKYYKRILRQHTILNMVLSTTSGTISATTINASGSLELDLFIKIILTIMAFIIAISNSYLKIYNIQEKVEKNIRLQQQWIQFGSTLTSEMQLPVSLRKDALYFIIKMNDTYTQLFKQHIVANRHILKEVAKKNGVNHDVLTLSDLFERTIQAEACRIQDAISVKIEPPVEKKPLLKMLKFTPRQVPTQGLMSPRKNISSYVLNTKGTRIEDESSMQNSQTAHLENAQDFGQITPGLATLDESSLQNKNILHKRSVQNLQIQSPQDVEQKMPDTNLHVNAYDDV